MRYIVVDSEGNFMRAFRSYKEASTYKFTRGNYGWEIIEE